MISERETTQLDERLRTSIRESKVAQCFGTEETACALILLSQSIWVCAFIYPNQHNFSAFETMLVRGITVTFMNYFICVYYGFQIDFHPKKVPFYSLTKRNVFMALHGIICAFIQFFLPLPVVHILGCTGSIFVCIADYVQNGVKLNAPQIKGMAIGFIGILFVINDKIILHWLGFEASEYSQFQNYHSRQIWITTLLSFLFLVTMMCWGFAVVETKKLTNTNTFPIYFIFQAQTQQMGLCIVWFSAISFPFLDSNASIKEILTAIIVQGIPMSIGQIMFIWGLTLSDQHGKLSILTFNLVITAYILSIFRYHEPVNMIALGGTILAAFGVIKCLLNKN